MSIQIDSNFTSNDTHSDCTTSYEEGDYRLTLRIISIFVLLVTSFIGVATPTLVKGRNWKAFDRILVVGKFFGAGVITATGFVHIFPDSVSTLTDPCLPEFYQIYPASAGLFALAAALFTHLMEYIALNFVGRVDAVVEEKKDQDEEGGNAAAHGHSHLLNAEHSNRVAVYILELGIAIHSVIIGVDLGLAMDEFETLFIALVFHQFFEGIGLGYRLAELKTKKKWRALINCLFYSVTTPLGVAIGVATHIETANTNYIVTTEVKGIMDSLAAGILIYVALVSLLAEEFMSESFSKLSKFQKVINFVALYFGAGIMSLIGLWA